uniref:Calponin-homology (CH) domain-containing protein n=1 Tax=Chelonoidis abingdonii TaxID=106734 RepID=A0A8C0IS40_CHEAB
MPGVHLPSLDNAREATVEEIQLDLQAFQLATERRLEEALQQLQPLASALNDLKEEHLVLRGEQARLGRQLEVLTLWLGARDLEEKDPSTLFLEAQDPCAHFAGTEEPSSPVAHPPTFSSTRRQSSVHLSRSNSFMEAEPVEQPQVPVPEPELSNGMEKAQAREPEKRSKLSAEELSRIEEEEVLDKMLDQTLDFEERRLIRSAMRELRQRKRGSYGSTFVQTKSSYSSSSKKVGSIFDREDESSSRQGSLAALERRQAEKKKELLKAQSLPKTSATQARKAMIEKLEKESGSPAMSRVAVQRSSSFGVPNANSIKQMLLDWCRAKTRGYEHVDIQNFSSSWSDGMAFCALVHNFFPQAFDYTQLTPQNRRRNFEVAFSSAEKHADCPQLLDVEDMVRMREPDWKCVYTYIQEFYRCLVQKGLVKTKKS